MTADEIASSSLLPADPGTPTTAACDHPTKLRIRPPFTWQSLTDDQREALRADPDPAVRARRDEHGSTTRPHTRPTSPNGTATPASHPASTTHSRSP
ncbi:hypothetical protein GCM10020229_60310 [Kitasatospora albolonga]